MGETREWERGRGWEGEREREAIMGANEKFTNELVLPFKQFIVDI